MGLTERPLTGTALVLSGRRRQPSSWNFRPSRLGGPPAIDVDRRRGTPLVPIGSRLDFAHPKLAVRRS